MYENLYNNLIKFKLILSICFYLSKFLNYEYLNNYHNFKFILFLNDAIIYNFTWKFLLLYRESHGKN